MYKPQVPYTPQIYKNFQTRFGGYNHTSSCGEGEIYDMKNIGHEEFPVLTPRRGRNTAPAFDNKRAGADSKPFVYDIAGMDEAYVIENSAFDVFWAKDVIKSFEVVNKGFNYVIARSRVGADPINNDLTRDLVPINKYIAVRNAGIFRRDMKGIVDNVEKLITAKNEGIYEPKIGDVYGVYDFSFSEEAEADYEADGIINKSYEAKYMSYYYWDGRDWIKIDKRDYGTGAYLEVVFKNGTYKGEFAEANTIYCARGFREGLQPGDGVVIVGCTEQPANNKAAVIKEISEDRTELRFYENTFTLVNGTDTEEHLVDVSREMPELDFMCHCNNRLFGCKGDTIYASKLGDPYNWNVFEGISTDSYSVDVGSAGDFTGCCAYGGDVLFFKEERIYKLMYTDSSPENWSLVEIETYGVKAGCEKSLAIADSCLFYYSPKGMMRYTGSLPMSINEAFGDQEFVNAVAGSDGKDYYVCLTDKAGESSLFVYDTTHYIWFKQDGVKVKRFVYYRGDLYALKVSNGEIRGVPVRIAQKNIDVPVAGEWFDMESMIEFGDVMNDTTNKKLKLNISVTAEVETRSELKFYVSCDGLPYEFLGEIKGESSKQTHKFSYVPTRCDYYRLKVEGKGLWKIYAISNGYTPGSDI